MFFLRSLSNNAIKDVPTGSFTVNNRDIVELDLSYNDLPVITDDVFAHLTVMKEL